LWGEGGRWTPYSLNNAGHDQNITKSTLVGFSKLQIFALFTLTYN
jgi:hypothetical protein